MWGQFLEHDHLILINQRTGVATISGSYTCTVGATFTAVVFAEQQHGRNTVEEYGESSESICDGSRQRWSVDVTPQDGKFVGGKINVEGFGLASNAYESSITSVKQEVKLRGGGK